MSSPILFSRLISRISRLPTQPFFVPRQNFISITVDNEFVKQSEKQLKEENEQAEVDVSEFGSDPYPFWRKVFMLPFILAYMNIHISLISLPVLNLRYLLMTRPCDLRDQYFLSYCQSHTRVLFNHK